MTTSSTGASAVLCIQDESIVRPNLAPGQFIIYADDAIVGLKDHTTLSIYDRSDPTAPPMRQLDRIEYAVADDSGQMLCSTYDGQLLKFNPATGAKKTLFDARKWTTELAIYAGAIAVLFPFAWLLLAARFGRLSTFFECTAFFAVFFAAWIGWWLLGMPRSQSKQLVLEYLVDLLLVTVLPVMILWASTLKSIWRNLLPIATVAVVGLTLSLLSYAVASDSPSARLALKLPIFGVTAGFLLFWSYGGFALLRALFGNISQLEHPAIPDSQSTVFTIRQLAVITAAFAIFFAFLSSTDLMQPENSGELVWLATATLVNAWVTLCAIGCVFNFRITLVGFAVWICLVSASAATHYKLALESGIGTKNLADLNRIRWYPTILISGFLVFIVCRFIRSRNDRWGNDGWGQAPTKHG